MRRNCCTLLAVGLLASFGAGASAQTAVGNAGFEATPMYDVPPALGNWTGFFGGPATSILDASVQTTAPRAGQYALHLKVAGEGNAFCGMQQPVNGVQPGVSYTMKLWARRAGNINNAVEFRFEWKNTAGGYIGDQFALTTRIDSTLTNDYQQYQLTAVAPAGAASANLVLDVQSFTFNPVMPVFDTEVFIDDVEFAATPLSTQYACCFPDGTCQVALVDACPPNSAPLPAGTSCSPNNCPPPAVSGACCNTGTGACVVTYSTICTPLGGAFHAGSASCTAGLCSVAPVCRADFNGNHAVEVQDIFDYLAAWFTGCP